MINKTTRRVLAGMGAVTMVGLISASDAAAQSAQTDLNVSATVVANCEIDVDTHLDFGDYDSLDSNDLEGTGVIEVRCTQGAGVSVELGNGGNFSGGTRRMSGPGDLAYALYSDVTHNDAWIGANTVDYIAPNNSPNPLTVYGVIPAGQDVPVGSYADTVVATVNF